MKFSKIILLFIFILPFLFQCKNDSSTNPSTSNSNFFIYGLLGRSPDTEKPDSNHFWIYMRVFNHPEVQNVQIELTHSKNKIPLEGTYRESDKFFLEGLGNFYFNSNEVYGVTIWDSKNTYTGEITTLPRLEITLDTVIAGKIKLEWTDIKADFYDVEFRNYPELLKHFQVTDNKFEIDLNDLPINSVSQIYINIAGFKGFNPESQPDGNIIGCYGFLFGYSRNETQLDLETMQFSKPNQNPIPPNIDNLILSLLKSNPLNDTEKSSEAIKFQFTYGNLSSSNYTSSSWNNFYGVTIVEPANSVNVFKGYLNNVELMNYNWGGFYTSFRSIDKPYETYNKQCLFKFKLNINNQLDSATVAVPDTFSFTSYLPEDQIPSTPFTIKWRKPDNAEYFFVYVSWEIKGDNLNKNFLYVTNDNNFTFEKIPDSLKSGTIYVVAINGTSPMKSLEPNLKNLNGYFYSRRQCRKSIYFSDENSNRALPSNKRVEDNKTEIFARIDKYLLSRLEEKYPQLHKYKQTIQKHLIN